MAADAAIGRIMDTLESAGMSAETLVVLTSDNGMSLGHHGIHGKLRALHAHSNDGVIERCLADLRHGMRLVLVSDAGTRCFSSR